MSRVRSPLEFDTETDIPANPQTATPFSAPVNRIAVVVLAVGLFFAIVGLPAKARADEPICFSKLNLVGASLLGTGLLGLPAAFSRDTRAMLGVGGGTSGVDFNGSLSGYWGRFGYQAESFGTYRFCGFKPSWWNSSVSFSAFIVDREHHELRGLLGVAFNGGTQIFGVSSNLGLGYLVRIAPDLRFAARLRYLPGINIDLGLLSGSGQDAVMHGFRSNVRMQWKATSGFQPYLEVVGGTVRGKPIHGERPVMPLFVSGRLGLQVRWAR